MKKSVALLAGLLGIMLIAFCGCNTEGVPEIPECPEDTDLEFWIVEDVSNISWENYDGTSGWGVQEYYGKGYERFITEDGEKVEREYYVQYKITAWPDYSDGGNYVTGIKITDPAVTVYGLTVNSSEEEFDAVFQEKGYELYNFEAFNYSRRVASKDGFTFSIDEKYHVIRIGATVTNRNNILF